MAQPLSVPFNLASRHCWILSFFLLAKSLKPACCFFFSLDACTKSGVSRSIAAATSKSLQLGVSYVEGDTADIMTAPLYITLGPPCSGKTTWLKGQSAQPSVVDISLDDQPNVYVPIPAELFAASADKILEKKALSSESQKLLQTSIFQKTLQERLLSRDTQEMRFVWQRLSGTITKDELESSLRKSHEERVQNGRHNHNRQQQQHRNKQKTAASDLYGDIVMTTLLGSVERVVGQRQQTQSVSPLPETVDLFVVEALFRNKPGNITGIERATNLLKQTPNTTSVAWGNTNTKPSDYSQTLEIAQQQGRPVHFCIFDSGPHSLNDKDNDASGNNCDELKNSLFDLPHVSYSQLMDRNIQRLVKSGRYVPSKAIWDASSRVETLVSDAIGQVRHSKTRVADSNTTTATAATSVTKLELDRQLARLAGFDMKDDCTVSKMSGGGNPRYNNSGRNSNGNGWPFQQQRHTTGRSFGRPSNSKNGQRGNDSSNRNTKRNREESLDTTNQKASSKPKNKLPDS